MATNAPLVLDSTLQKLIDILISCIVLPDGVAPDDAPNAFKDSNGMNTITETADFDCIIHIDRFGGACIEVRPLGSKCSALNGVCNIGLLATKLV